MAGGAACRAKGHRVNRPAEKSPEPKAILRRELRERLKAMSDARREEESAKIRQHLLAEPAWRDATSILAFVPTASEPDVWPSIRAAHAAGRTICLPRFDPETNTYRPCLVSDLDKDLSPGPYGIREPGAQCTEWNGKALDLILVPGLGFDASGARLGRGKGYYDRLLAGGTGCKCGVAFEAQMIPELPMEPHDVRLDLVITPSGCLRSQHRLSTVPPQPGHGRSPSL